MAEIAPGEYSLCLEAGTTDVDHVIHELGHEANGYFWEGIVELLVTTEAPTLDGRFESDPEGGAFYAYSGDCAALEDLAIRLRAVAGDEQRLRELVRLAETVGFEFDD
ncbi:Imm51 family immunity protein [Dactylosporangium cerinum]|uniref:Imm51 family immunity protein n=1 Tax=Dactylosporangium cerinum TaxID=1434730 RepID=A0ABV9W6B2_9ACTN